MKRSAWILGLSALMTAPVIAAEDAPFTPAPLVDMRGAPVSPSTLTAGKKEDAATLLLRAAVRENVTAADGFEELVERQKARDAALMKLIAPDSPITHAAAKALRAYFGSFLTDNVTPESAEIIALQMVRSVFLNRRDDLASMQELYDSSAWKQKVRTRLHKGDIPELSVSLKAEKRAELKNTALYVHTPGSAEGKMEPALHVIMTALGHQIGHAGLADVMRSDSPVHGFFLEAIARDLPKDPAAKEWMSDWLYLRTGRADAVVNDFRPDGELMQEAVAEFETKRRARLKSPPPVERMP